MCGMLTFEWKDILLFVKGVLLHIETDPQKKDTEQDPSLKYNRNDEKANMSCLDFYHLHISADTGRNCPHPFTSQQKCFINFSHTLKWKLILF